MADGGRATRAIDRLTVLGMYGAEACLAAMMILIAVEVVCRSFLNFSIIIVDETCGYLVAAMLFLGAAYSLRQQALLRVEFIITALPARLRPAVDLVYDVLSLGFALILLHQMGRLAYSSWDRGMVAPTLMETPIWLPQLVLPAGAVLLVLALAAEIARDLARLAGREDAP